LVLTLDRQPRFNAWTTSVRSQFVQQLNMADRTEHIDAVVITGAGDKAFCAGQDLSELAEFEDGAQIEDWLGNLTNCYDSIRSFEKPLVSAVNGVAAGSGLQLTQPCDFVVAHPEVRMGQTEVNSGLPSVFGTWLMWERAGRRAIELTLQGRLMDIHEARDLVFVQKVVRREDVLADAIAIAVDLAKKLKAAYRLCKAANRAFDQAQYSAAMRLAGVAFRDAFDQGEPQKTIRDFFALRGSGRDDATSGGG
jgi:enoyl-CoA hydratase